MFGVAQNVQEVVVDPRLPAVRHRHGRGHQHGGRADSRAQRRARGTDAGAAERAATRCWARARTACAATSRCSPPRSPSLCLPLSAYRPLFFAGFLLTLVAGLLLTPFLSLELARLLRRPMKWLRPVEGALAADSLIQAPRRTSATVAALMLSLALVVGQGGVARASLQSIDEWMTNTLNPDLFVSTTENIASHGCALSRQPCSRSWKASRASPKCSRCACRALQFHGYPVMLVAIELASVGRRVKRHMIAGRRRRP